MECGCYVPPGLWSVLVSQILIDCTSNALSQVLWTVCRMYCSSFYELCVQCTVPRLIDLCPMHCPKFYALFVQCTFPSLMDCVCLWTVWLCRLRLDYGLCVQCTVPCLMDCAVSNAAVPSIIMALMSSAQTQVLCTVCVFYWIIFYVFPDRHNNIMFAEKNLTIRNILSGYLKYTVKLKSYDLPIINASLSWNYMKFQ